MRVLVAPDKFKGSRTAAQVAADIAIGLRIAQPSLEIVELPIADGGDGTVAAAVSNGFDAVEVEASGPTGHRVTATYARRGGLAVVELAAVCGLAQLPGGLREPVISSTYGLGQVIDEAIKAGVTDIVVGLGGSASTDGGAGMIQALGARLLDAAGAEIPRGGAGLIDLTSIDLSGLHRRIDGISFILASDVENPLLGPSGAAAVFGPQKGATSQQVQQLEAALARWATVVGKTTGADLTTQNGAGAAGGTGFAALTLLGAQLRSGAELMLELVGFTEHLADTDLVITGEGMLDEQSLSGKAPMVVARAAGVAGIPVVAIVGHTTLGWDRVQAAGLNAVYPLSDIQPDQRRSMTEASQLLRLVASKVALKWCGPQPRRF